jgi:hypothetical protein
MFSAAPASKMTLLNGRRSRGFPKGCHSVPQLLYTT